MPSAAELVRSGHASVTDELGRRLTVNVKLVHTTDICLRLTADESDTVWLAAITLLRRMSASADGSLAHPSRIDY